RMSTIVDEKEDKEQYTGSREARRLVMEEGINAFLDRPLTGVGAGQFKNYNPPGRKEPWRETHNVVLQVAADLGVFGLAAFLFLIGRAAMVSIRTTRVLAGTAGRRAQAVRRLFTEDDRRILHLQSVAMTAGLAGWFTCALFASVAYSWTF